MKAIRFFLLIVLLASGIGIAASNHGRADMHKGPEGAVHAVMAAIKAKDGQALSTLLSPSVVLRRVAVGEPDDSPALRSRDIFIQDILSSESDLEEQINIMSVSRDGPVAQVWTGYVFYINGTLSHCGHNAFTLVEQSGGWRITDITYTARRHGCETVDGPTD